LLTDGIVALPDIAPTLGQLVERLVAEFLYGVAWLHQKGVDVRQTALRGHIEENANHLVGHTRVISELEQNRVAIAWMQQIESRLQS
jgi:hypothetical protein